MKKNILLGIIILLLVPVTNSTGVKCNEEDILMGILEELDGEFLEGDINVGGTILDEFIDKKQVEIISDEVKKHMKILGKEADLNRDISNLEGKYYSKEVIVEDGFNQVSIYGFDKYKNPITIIVTSYLDLEDNIGETSIYINLIKVEQNISINDIISNINNVYIKYDRNVENTVCVIGTASGKLKENQLNKNINGVLKKYNGKIVEKYSDKSVSSYTIYTPLIEKQIFSGKKKVNLNLAIRYNEYEDKMYFWIGTPVITIGY